MRAIALLMVLVGPVHGWGWSVHRLVAYRAAQALVKRLPRHEKAWRKIHEGAVAPDAQGPGHIPAKDHCYHVTPDRHGRHLGAAPRLVQQMFWRLMTEQLPDDLFLFEMGRISHLVADLTQPLHTDGTQRNEDEKRFHPKFERAADDDLEVARMIPVPEAPEERAAWVPQDAAALDWDARMVALAEESWKDYDRIGAAYAPGGPGYPATRAVVRRRVERAVRVVVELWAAILEKRGHAERIRREAGVWSCLAVPVVLMWFVYRGRLKVEGGGYPGEKPAGAAERRRADEAFRRLEERVGIKRGVPP